MGLSLIASQVFLQPMKIAIVHAADVGSGAERCVMELLTTLNESGHPTQLYAGSKASSRADVIEIPRTRPIPGLLRLTRWMENRLGVQNFYAPWFRGLPELIGPCDVVHVHTLWGGTYGYSDLMGLMHLAKRYPTVLTLHDGWMLTGHCACPIRCERWKTGCGHCPDLKRTPAVPYDLTAWNWWRKRNAIQSSNLHITAVSSWLSEQVRQSPIFAGKPVSVVYNSVDETVFRPGDRQAVRMELGLPEHARLILLAGQTVEGIRDGIAQHAAAALNRLSIPGLNVVIVGRSAEAVAKTLSIPAHVLPFQKTPAEMARCYLAADLTVVSSEYETFGRVAAESLMCATPVVSFATGGLAEVVEHNVTGLLVPTGDTAALAEAIRLVVEDQGLRERLAQAAAARAHARFNRRVVTEDYLEVYRTVLAQRTASANGHASERSAGERPQSHLHSRSATASLPLCSDE